MKSISLFIGTGECNGRCRHCAGIPVRKYAPKYDGKIDSKLILETIKKCYSKGARYLSIVSSGEPTLSPISVTKVLQLIRDCKEVSFSPINIYTNGIRIGSDREFCKKYLSLWKKLGLTTFYLTVHSIDEERNAKIYGIKKYPRLRVIISRIKSHNFDIRVNMILSKKIINSSKEFKKTVSYLRSLGVDSFSAWPLRKMDDTLDESEQIPKKEIEKIKKWSKKQDFKIRIFEAKNSKKPPINPDKLILFPNGLLDTNWCN